VPPEVSELDDALSRISVMLVLGMLFIQPVRDMDAIRIAAATKAALRDFMYVFNFNYLSIFFYPTSWYFITKL
jgi:hypothetical protein